MLHRPAVESDGPISLQLPTREIEKLSRGRAVAGEIAVDASGAGVTLLSRIEDQHPAKAPAKHERGAEPGGPAAHHDAIPAITQVRLGVGTSAASSTCLNLRRSSAT